MLIICAHVVSVCFKLWHCMAIYCRLHLEALPVLNLASYMWLYLACMPRLVICVPLYIVLSCV